MTEHPRRIDGELPPHAALLVRVATLINDEQLPPARLTIGHNGAVITVDATDTDLPENAIRRWAQALDAIVYERPGDLAGVAASYFSAERTINGTFWTLFAFVPVPALVSA